MLSSWNLWNIFLSNRIKTFLLERLYRPVLPQMWEMWKTYMWCLQWSKIQMVYCICLFWHQSHNTQYTYRNVHSNTKNRNAWLHYTCGGWDQVNSDAKWPHVTNHHSHSLNNSVNGYSFWFWKYILYIVIMRYISTKASNYTKCAYCIDSR